VRQSTPTDLQRDQHDPAARLADATRRYIDGLHVAAEDLAEAQGIAALERVAEQAIRGLSDKPAGPTLRARLLVLAADHIDPIAHASSLGSMAILLRVAC